tara:strand:+ start:32 stop:421 length:390 start_codon:yes stop_codon:yes gene_type:complete
MPKKPSRKTLVRKLDTVFSKYIRQRGADKYGICTCVTCGKKLHISDKNLHCGHFISRKHYSTRWDENNAACQCSYCNSYRYGEQYKFSLYLGKDLSESLHLQSKLAVKFSNTDLVNMIDDFNEKLEKLT